MKYLKFVAYIAISVLKHCKIRIFRQTCIKPIDNITHGEYNVSINKKHWKQGRFKDELSSAKRLFLLQIYY